MSLRLAVEQIVRAKKVRYGNHSLGERLLEMIRARGSISDEDLAEAFGVTPKAVNCALHFMVKGGRVLRRDQRTLYTMGSQ